MDEGQGWFSRTADGDWSPTPTDEQRARLEAKLARRRAERGKRIAIVQVEVFENGECVPHVSFPPGGTLGIDSEPQAIRTVVMRAKDALADWR